MHMTNALISPAVGAVLYAVSAGANVYAVKKIKNEGLIPKERLPVVGAAGALVFAAQMFNFTIPYTGSSGHIAGGVLLAAIIGAYPALLTISAALLIQCLCFADGGLVALGCNIFNMGLIPCLIVYPLVFKPIVKKGMSNARILAASVIACVIALQVGAFSVSLQTLISGINELPLISFLSLMQPIHLAIGIIEGVITAGVLCLMFNSRFCADDKKTLIFLSALTVIAGGFLSPFASRYPDGLLWSIEKTVGATAFADMVSFMPDYSFEFAGVFGTSVAGMTGAFLTFALLYIFFKASLCRVS